MDPITTYSARMVALPIENIDTDQIIPARFLKVTDKAGLGQSLFADWRYRPDGTPDPDFVLNQPEAQGSGVLLAGHNFGCGSSREHAPWALVGFGFRAVVSTYFADIFRNNALKNGLIPIMVDADTHQRLLRLAESGTPELTVDLAAQTVTLPDGESVQFPIEPFAQHCLLNGVDQLGFLLGEEQSIARFEAEHPQRVRTTAARAEAA
jgi:3-isopropylmalate/(R)-2-methylmalate dehydratase small subunit